VANVHSPSMWLELQQVIIDKNTRNKRKCVTTVFGLDSFGVKLSEAAKLFGKKFASGAAVVKSPTEKEQIDIQGDCLEKVLFAGMP
jgi:density-regulated protein